jgi:Ca2+-binding EF-hand superfamily protein
MAYQSSVRTQHHRNVEVPGDTDAADIVGRTGEEMPRQAHDDGDDDDRGTGRQSTWQKQIGGEPGQRRVMRVDVERAFMLIVSLLTFSCLALQFASVSATVVLASSDAASQRRNVRMKFDVMDRNGDGRIARDEWRGSPRSFDVHDWNGDGQLSGDEVRIGAQRTTDVEQADHDPSRSERNLAWTASGFATLDHNRDGRLTPNEWHYDLETFHRVDRNRNDALSRQEFLGGDVDDDRGDQFDDLDLNNNGRIERSEWHASADAFSWLDRNRDGVLNRIEVTGAEGATTNASDQFASLDSDRNRTISRNEWHWSPASFNQLDLNRDGVLTQSEFNAVATPATAPTSSQTVRVNAQERWTDTGMTVRAGEILTFEASGTIQMTDDARDTATPAGSTKGRRAPNAPILNALAGSLIAKIGESAPILVGDRRSLRASASGPVYLGVNDDHLPDNNGEFVVTIGIQGRTTRH